MIKIEFIVCFCLIITNILIHFMFEKQEKSIEKILKETNQLNKEIELINVNLSFLKRQENLKKINDNQFKLQPYDILDIIQQKTGTRNE